jgi:hypothetical protein
VGEDPTEPCGKSVTHGSGPDATVSYTPCPGDEPPTEPQPQVVAPTPGMADVYARRFDTATVGDDDRTVRIDFVSGIEPCYVLDHVDVTYASAAVTITLYEGHQSTNEDVACIDIGVFKRVIARSTSRSPTARSSTAPRPHSDPAACRWSDVPRSGRRRRSSPLKRWPRDSNPRGV